MNLEQMQYVLEVEKTKSITLAASALSVTQSTISQAITRLENELGMPLFSRSRNGAFMLEQAKPILDKMKSIVDMVQTIKEDAQYIGESIRGELRLSAIPGGVPGIIPTIASMKKRYPDLKFELSESAARNIIKDVRNKQVDLGLIALYQDDMEQHLAGLHFVPIDEGVMRACVNLTNRLAGQKSISLHELKNETLVLFNDELVDDFIGELSQRVGEVDVLFRTNNSEVVNAALAQLNAVTIGHEYSFTHDRSVLHYDFTTLEIEGIQRVISIGWVMRESKSSNLIIQRFLDRFQSKG